MNDLPFRDGAVASPVVSAASQQVCQSDDGLVDRLPVGVYTCDRDGRIVRYNRRAAELWGRKPGFGELENEFFGSHGLLLLDGRPLPHDAMPVGEVLRTAKAVRDRTLIIERPDRSQVLVLVNIDPLFDTVCWWARSPASRISAG